MIVSTLFVSLFTVPKSQIVWLYFIAVFSASVNVVSASSSSSVFSDHTNSNPFGISSVISEAYPSISPSLYTLNVYFTISPFFTDTGSLFNLYVAVVAVLFAKFVISTLSILSGTLVPFTSTILFINFKSNAARFNTNFSKSSSSCCPL